MVSPRTQKKCSKPGKHRAVAALVCFCFLFKFVVCNVSMVSIVFFWLSSLFIHVRLFKQSGTIFAHLLDRTGVTKHTLAINGTMGNRRKAQENSPFLSYSFFNKSLFFSSFVPVALLAPYTISNFGNPSISPYSLCQNADASGFSCCGSVVLTYVTSLRFAHLQGWYVVDSLPRQCDADDSQHGSESTPRAAG